MVNFNHTDSYYLLEPAIIGEAQVEHNGWGTTVFVGDNHYRLGTAITSGTLQVGDGGVRGSLTGDVVNDGQFVFDRSDRWDFDGSISGNGVTIQGGAGTTVLTGNSGAFTGQTHVKAGTLRVDGGLSGAMYVGPGGALGGIGQVDVTRVEDGGTLLGYQGDVFHIGDLTLAPGAQVNVALGAPDSLGLFDVAGNLTLDGTLNVEDVGGFGAGLYRIFDYGGALTDNGLAVGALPAGVDAADIGVQLAPNQVNLINLAGLALNFWDGAQTSGNGVVDGGSGVWDAARTNWTTSDGALNGIWNSGFAIFQGAPGTVQVDDSLGAIATEGMQFVVGGYRIEGDAITLGKAETLIRVGAGARSARAGTTATIASALTGAGGLVKSDLGTLVLEGQNSYAGGTIVQSGVLAVAADGNLGAAAGGIALAGGTLRNSAAFATARTVTLGAVGGTLETAADLTVSGVISGSGELTKAGAGTLILTANNSFAGNTDVNAGTLQVDGALAGPVHVATGAVLGGAGQVGATMIDDGGTLLGNRGAVLTVAGDLTLAPGAQVNVTLGAPDPIGLFDVTGNLTLDGTLNVTDTGGFGPGLYRIIDYAGTLTNRGLDLGSLPAGANAGDIGVQLAPNQVNLVNTAGLALDFWDGANLTGNNLVDGGAGIWNAAKTNWTTSDGALNGKWNSGFAVFQGVAGIVQVEDNLGAIASEGMQFAVGGYRIQGDAITLSKAQTLIRVGDGPGGGAVTATIASVLAGAGALVKTDPGILVIEGRNRYAGGTIIRAGVVQVSSDGNLGAAPGGIAFEGGTLRNRAAFVTPRAVTLSAAGGTFETAADLTASGIVSGAGRLTKAGAGTLILTASNSYSGGTAIVAGTVQIGNGGTSGAIAGNVVNDGQLAFNRADTVQFGGAISGGGTIAQTGAGTTRLTGISNAFTGATAVKAGTLLVDGTLTGGMQVASGAMLGGIGQVGSTMVAGGGILLGNQGDVLTIAGDLVLASGANLKVALGAPDTLGLFDVTGNLTLDGIVQIEDVGGFGPGLYRIIDYAGGLTDNGLEVVAVPAGSNVADIKVQLAPNQVNLVNTAGLALNFWDGANTSGNNLVDGGSGTWDAGKTNWTTFDGAVNGKWNSGFAVFQGAPGIVRVDGSLGAIATEGMQFAVGGYRVEGDAIALSKAQTLIRVGAGARGARAGTVATIASRLTGAGALVKTDLGTLVLEGQNNYAGGTIVRDGVLQVSSDGNLGAASGGLAFEGGTLRTSAAFATARAVTLGAEGGTFETLADLTASGVIAGAGELIKAGAGTLILTADNIYSGGTEIAAGTVQIGNGGTAGSIAGNVANDGQLAFNRADAVQFGGAISGGGTIAQAGAGTTRLTGASNAFTGTTKVSAGTLLVDGTLTGGMQVASGAMLGGIGQVGSTMVAGGGILLGNQGDVLTIAGDLVLASGASLNVALGAPDTLGLFDVTGNLTLDGIVRIEDVGGFGAGLYRLIDYAGTLTDNGLEVGNLPAGANAADIKVQLAPSQVNLVNTAGLALNFWDGANTSGNDVVDGGSGKWDAGKTNWTTFDGAVNGKWNGGFAVFQGIGGTVRVDGSLGAIASEGMQFAVGGYRVEGDAIVLSKAQTLIRVGAGARSDRIDTVATIASVLAGGGALVKTDLGTLVLEGQNSYSGGTIVRDGVLQIAADGNLGASAGGLGFEGGTLRNTAALETARAVTLSAAGGTFETLADLTASGVIAGAGRLTKAGAGTLILTAGNHYTGGTTISAGTLQIGNGGTSGAIAGNVTNHGQLVFDRSDAVAFGGVIAGSGGIQQIGSGTTTLSADSAQLTGLSQVRAGILAVNGVLGGALRVIGGQLQGSGTVGATTLDAGGIIAPGNSIGILTVNGDYRGNGGLLRAEVVLGDDASAADLLAVTGSTAGTTNVQVVNVGGAGGQTVNGIKLVSVGGASNGIFTLKGDYVFEGDQAVVGGAYAYRLYKNGVADPLDGDWYLRSTLIDAPNPNPPVVPPLYQPGVPVYETYPQALPDLNGLATLQQRVGNRSWAGNGGPVAARGSAAAPEGTGAAIEGSGIWGRVEGAYGKTVPSLSTARARYDQNSVKLQGGIDAMLSDTDGGKLVAGLNLRYAHGKTGVRSVYGDGDIASNGYGLGGTVTWYGDNGFYLDGQGQATWYKSKLHSRQAGGKLADRNRGFGYALSLEAGQRIAIGPAWSLTPQAQLTYSSIGFDAFTDRFGATVSLDRGKSLQSRLGLAIAHENSWQNADGKIDRSRVYAITNLQYEFLRGTQVLVSSTAIAARRDRLTADLGIGTSHSWDNDKYAFFAEGSINTSLNNPAQSYAIKGNIGFRAKW